MELLEDAARNAATSPRAGGLRLPPAPLRGGPLALARFMRANGMLRPGYAALLVRLAWLKLRFGRRLQTDGLCFVCPGVKIEIGRNATLRIGRWAWLGHGCKVRVHEGEVSIGAKTVIGQECTISAFQHVSIGRECIIADRVMLIDFDHGVTEVERPIRLQGIYKRDVDVGHNVWIGYGACILRGVSVGENSIIGTSAVVTRSFGANSVLAGVPARLIRTRDAPESMRWADRGAPSGPSRAPRDHARTADGLAQGPDAPEAAPAGPGVARHAAANGAAPHPPSDPAPTPPASRGGAHRSRNGAGAERSRGEDEGAPAGIGSPARRSRENRAASTDPPAGDGRGCA